MGLYDEVQIDPSKLPDAPSWATAETLWQTKDLKCWMHNYTVDENGVLCDEFEGLTYSGHVDIYWGPTTTEWAEYRLVFVRGKLMHVEKTGPVKDEEDDE